MYHISVHFSTLFLYMAVYTPGCVSALAGGLVAAVRAWRGV